MKPKDKIHNLFFVSLLLLLFLGAFISIPSEANRDMPERGAESPEKLSDALFHAIQMNQFQNLDAYIPKEEEISRLQKNATARNKPYFENLEATEINESLKSGFENIIRKGIEKNINWSSTELVDYETRTCSIELIGCNVTYTMIDQNGRRLVVTYDAIKVKDRWFLFQNLGLGRE